MYFDEEFDDTPYNILKLYEKEKKEMEPEHSLFLIENLIERHNVESDHATELAETLIAGKKKILDGHYAILEIYPKLDDSAEMDLLNDEEKKAIESEGNIRKKVFYYRRLKFNWIRDDEIEIESFMDSNDVFAIYIKGLCKKNNDNKICETPEQAKKPRVKNENKDALKKEFNKKI